jgi:hypothetical protein
LVLLNAAEGGRLWEILVDPLWPVPDQTFEIRRDLARTAVKDLVNRGWVQVFVARGWPEQSSEEPQGEALVAVMDDEASWRLDDQAGLPKDQFMQIEIATTDAGDLAIKDGAAPDAFRRLHEHLRQPP